MMKKTLVATGFAILFFGIMAFEPPPPGKKITPRANTIKTVIIDPGHGGIDPGAKGLFSHEANVALAISLKFGEMLQEAFPGVKIIYTRTTDILPGNLNNIKQALRYRAELANQSKADLYISVHCNATGERAGGWYARRVVGHKRKLVYTGRGRRRKKRWVNEPIYHSYWVENTRKGTETYIWAADRSDDKQQYIQDNEETGEQVEDSTNMLDLNSPEANLRAQLYTKYYFKKSALLAQLVEEEFENAGRNSGGVKQRNNKGIWVLQATGMPSILVETGFITNRDEEKYLNSESGQNEVATNILGAFRKYKQEVEGQKGGVNGKSSGSKK